MADYAVRDALKSVDLTLKELVEELKILNSGGGCGCGKPKMAWAGEFDPKDPESIAAVEVASQKVGVPIKIIQKNHGPVHGNNYNCGDGTGCRCNEE